MIAVTGEKGAVLFWRLMPALMAVCIASGSAPRDPGAFADVQLTVMGGFQVRAIDLVPPKSVGLEDEWPSFIRLQLKLRGRAVRNVSEIGEVVLREATDDLGRSMLEAAQDEPGICREGIKTDDGLTYTIIYLDLEDTSRQATRIARLKGEVPVVAGGKRISIDFPRITTLFGTTLEHSALSQAGLTIKVGALEQNGDYSFPLTVSGDFAALRSVRVQKAGTTDRAPNASQEQDGSWHVTLPNVPGENDLLHLEVVTEQRIITVPIDFANIPIP